MQSAAKPSLLLQKNLRVAYGVNDKTEVSSREARIRKRAEKETSAQRIKTHEGRETHKGDTTEHETQKAGTAKKH